MCTRQLLSSWSLSCVSSVSAVPLLHPVVWQDENECQGLEVLGKVSSAVFLGPGCGVLGAFGPELPLTHSEYFQGEISRLIWPEIQRRTLKICDVNTAFPLV